MFSVKQEWHSGNYKVEEPVFDEHENGISN